jgi:hypothetical protein
VTQPFDNRDWDLGQIAEKDVEIERLTNIVRATEVERDAGDKVAVNLRAEINQLKDRVKWLEIGIVTKDRLIAELTSSGSGTTGTPRSAT